MRLSEAIQLIKERISLVDLVGRYVDIKRNGPRFSGPCPFHQETKPSFSVNEDKGFFYCFGCQASGDLIEFYSRINGLDFRESVEQLAQEAGIQVDFESKSEANRGNKGEKKNERQEMGRMHEFASKIYAENLAEANGLACRQYLANRQTSREIIEKFELGWAPREWRFLEEKFKRRGFNLNIAAQGGLLAASENGNFYDRFRGRLMFPIKNLSGQTIAFGGRIIENVDEAKYINSPESPIYKKKENLYGLFQARKAITTHSEVMLTEGYMDVLTLHQYGFTNSVAALGTALTEGQVKKLSGFCSRFVLIFDGDAPGQKAALRAAAMILSAGLSCKVVILPPEDDIDSLLKTRGANAFEELKKNSPDGLQFCLTSLRRMAPLEAVNWVRDFLANVKVAELANSYATSFAACLNMEEGTLRQHAAEMKSRKKNVASGPRKLLEGRDRQILICAVRYPERIKELEEMGAGLALFSHEAKEFWQKLRAYPAEEILIWLDDAQKSFWQEHRGPDAAPLQNGDFELACLAKALDQFYENSRKASITRALAETCETADFNAQLEYLRAIQKTMENTDEQS